MTQIILAALIVLAGVLYYMQAGAVMAPIMLLLAGGIWLLVAIIRYATRRGAT